MSNPERFGTFYSVWPVLDGKPLNFQWGEIRSNQAEAKAVIRNSFQELEDGVDELNSQRAMLGLAFGDLVFSKRWRFMYNKITFELCCQRNTGTVADPIWVDAWCVRFSDGQFQAVGNGGIFSAAGFYNFPESLNEVAESGSSADVSIKHPTKIFFNADDGFGVTPIVGGANAGQPEIRFTQPFGRAQAFPKTGRVWQVDHNFGIKPVMVQIMDNDDRVVIPDVADVSNPNTAWFYFNNVFSGTAYIASGGVGATTLLPRDPFYLVVRTTHQSASSHLLKPNADVIFDPTFFYVNVDLDTPHGGAHKKAFISLTGTGGGSFDDSALLKLDGTRAMTGDLNMGGKDILNASSGNFNRPVTAEAFYLEPGSGGEVSKSGNDVLIRSRNGDVHINDDLRVTGNITLTNSTTISAPGLTVSVSGDATLNIADTLLLSASNQLNLDSGDTINLTSDGDTVLDSAGAILFDSAKPINFNNSGLKIFRNGSVLSKDKIVAEAFYLSSGGELLPGGLALISVRESDNTPPAFTSDTVVFNSENFYLDATSAGKPQVNLRPRIYGQVGAFTKQQYAVAAALTISAGAIAWNLDNAQVATLNLTTAATLSAPTNIKTGGQYTLIVTQVGGGNVLSFNGAFKFGDAGAPTLSSTAGMRDVLVFTGFGSEMFLVGVSTGY